jgi:hypothetical protein
LSQLAQQLLRAAPEANVCRAAMGGRAAAPATTATPSQPQPTQGLPKGLPEALRSIFK